MAEHISSQVNMVKHNSTTWLPTSLTIYSGARASSFSMESERAARKSQPDARASQIVYGLTLDWSNTSPVQGKMACPYVRTYIRTK